MKKIKWISVEDRLPDNAKDKDALCETVLVPIGGDMRADTNSLLSKSQ